MPPIQPRTLKGFRDYLPQVMLAREHIIDTARRVFRSFGFSPIDTPALEYLEILLGKGGLETDKQLYRFQDHGGRDVGMRFDLTVPLARFAAQHINELGTPFKRYHIATVWRGENTQAGRYREFMQCDFDTIGTKGAAADAETVLVAHELLRAIGFERFTIRINDRRVLSGLLETLGLEDSAIPVLRALDKIHKIGPNAVAAEIVQISAIQQKIDAAADTVRQRMAAELLASPNLEIILDLIENSIAQRSQASTDVPQQQHLDEIVDELIDTLEQSSNLPSNLAAIVTFAQNYRSQLNSELERIVVGAMRAKKILDYVQVGGDNDSILNQLSPLVAVSTRGKEGLQSLAQLLCAVRSAGIPEGRIRLDISIARGLDYYTGTVIETTLDDLPGIGSVCSGGRYDNLAELYSKQQLPGIGASLGLDRLIAAMEELGMLPTAQTPSQVFIPYFDAARLGDYFQLAAVLRAAGLAVEVYPEPTKLGKQLQYADRRGIRVAVIAGQREFDAGECQVKNLSSGESTTVSLAENAAELVDLAKRILGT